MVLVSDMSPKARFAMVRNRIRLELPEGAVCSDCGDPEPLHLKYRRDEVRCHDCTARKTERSVVEEHHLGGRPSLISTQPVTANDHTILSLLQSCFWRGSHQPGSAYALGFDLGAWLGLCVLTADE